MADATLVLTRPRTWVDKVRAYKVMVDGQQVGQIKEGSEESFPVPSGSHELQLRLDWGSSLAVRFEAAEGQTVRFMCKPKPNSFNALWYATVARKKYITLEPA